MEIIQTLNTDHTECACWPIFTFISCFVLNPLSFTSYHASPVQVLVHQSEGPPTFLKWLIFKFSVEGIQEALLDQIDV